MQEPYLSLLPMLLDLGRAEFLYAANDISQHSSSYTQLLLTFFVSLHCGEWLCSRYVGMRRRLEGRSGMFLLRIRNLQTFVSQLYYWKSFH